MKIRISFVSNSSNTSFCIAGVDLGWPRDQCIPIAFTKEELQQIESLSYKYGLTYEVNGYGEGQSWIGLSIENMKEDETLREFKNRATKLLEQLFEENNISVPFPERWTLKANILHEGWHEG